MVTVLLIITAAADYKLFVFYPLQEKIVVNDDKDLQKKLTQ
jgi:hypothetical protein